MRKRVSSSGQSNDLPLNVTSTGCSAIRSRSANKSAFLAILPQEELLNFKAAAFPPGDSNEKGIGPAATSKACGFGIQKEPLLGISDLSGPSGESNRTALLSGEYRGGLAHQQRTERYSPNWFFFDVAPRVRAKRSGSWRLVSCGMATRRRRAKMTASSLREGALHCFQLRTALKANIPHAHALHLSSQLATEPPHKRRRISSATSLVLSLRSAVGPTHEGHPFSHGQALISSRVRSVACRSSDIEVR